MNFTIGTVTTPNPWLWVDTANINNYTVSSESPGETWFQVNQFCSILAVTWLQNPADTLGFRDLTEADQLEDAKTLQGFASLQDQANYATAQLGGQKIDVATVIQQLPSYNAGAQLWLGNDVHTLGALVRQEGKVKSVDLYNPDTGQTENYQIDQFAALLPAYDINVAIVKTT